MGQLSFRQSCRKNGVKALAVVAALGFGFAAPQAMA